MSIEDHRKHAFAVPIFSVTDLDRSLHFYVEVLDFEKRWEWGDPPDYASVAFGDAELFLCQGGQGYSGTWMYLFIDSTDDYSERIKNQGADLIRGPAYEPRGSTVMRPSETPPIT